MLYAVGVVLLSVLYLEPTGGLNWLKGLKPEMKDVAQLLGLAVSFRTN